MMDTLSLALRRYRQVDLCEFQTSWNLLVTPPQKKQIFKTSSYKEFQNLIRYHCY